MHLFNNLRAGAATAAVLLAGMLIAGTRKAFTLAGNNGTAFTAYTVNGAFVSTYSLRRGDDGRPFEEYGLNGPPPGL
jgi:hypothetical protein